MGNCDGNAKLSVFVAVVVILGNLLNKSRVVGVLRRHDAHENSYASTAWFMGVP